LRKIGLSEIEDISLGAARLGAGGGGDPYVGKLAANSAVRECGPVTLLDPLEVPDDALVVPIAMMGAPTVLCEKAIGGKEYKTLYNMVSQFYGREIYAFMPIEAGGVNSMLPIAAAARMGLPLVDADGMGRAFPELQKVTWPSREEVKNSTIVTIVVMVIMAIYMGGAQAIVEVIYNGIKRFI
jgi:preprotein translocase SecE subunit